MQHQPLARPPLDIGATTLTSMSAVCQERLRDYLGLTGEAQPTNSGVDERLLAWAGADFRAVGRIVSLPSVHTRTLSATETVDCWGVRRKRVGAYSDIVASPLRGATREELKSFAWPEPRIDDALMERWVREASAWHADGRYVVIAEHPVYGVLELGCWMCGYEDFLYRLVGDPDFVRSFFDIVLDLQLRLIEPYYRALAPYIDLTTSGDDYGIQNQPLLSPRVFDELVAPYFAERIRRTKQWGRCYYWHHSCGSVRALLEQIIACGVDILNPIQTSAWGMAPAELKAAYGDRLVFWGAMDVQQFLPGATPAQVRAEANTLMDVLGRDGGYVMAPAHNMQDDVPPENIVAWVETVRARVD
jgi:uroporphyrinogen decarboxylase